jgi:hypothetical protein
MKHKIAALALGFLACASLRAADVAPTNQVSDAITKLKAASNYSWTTTTVLKDSEFTPGPIKGQADKDGFAKMSQAFGDNTTEIVLKGDKVAVNGDSGWTTLDKVEGFPAMMAGGLSRNGAAAEEAAIGLKQVKELKPQDGGVLGGDLTSEGATDMLAFGPRRAAGDNQFPGPKNAKGSVKFWLKDGQLAKYEWHLLGTVSFGDNDMEMDQTKTVEIQNVGTTKMDIPAEAKKLLEAKADAKPAAPPAAK